MNKKTVMLDQDAQKFVSMLNAPPGPQIYELPVDQARALLRKLQSRSIESPHVEKTEKIIEGASGSVSLTIVRPLNRTEELPAILYFHGGGWVLGDNVTHDHLIKELSVRSEAVVVFVNYTPSPEAIFPLAIEQGYDALLYLLDHGSEHKIDSKRLALAGDSAGGAIAAALLIKAHQNRLDAICFQALFYPVTDASMNTTSYSEFAAGYHLSKKSMNWFWENYIPESSERKSFLASPLQASIDQLRGLPPTLIITAECDVLRDEGEAYAHKLLEAGVAVTAARMLGVIHDFMMLHALAHTPATQGALDLAGATFKKAFVEK